MQFATWLLTDPSPIYKYFGKTINYSLIPPIFHANAKCTFYHVYRNGYIDTCNLTLLDNPRRNVVIIDFINLIQMKDKMMANFALAFEKNYKESQNNTIFIIFLINCKSTLVKRYTRKICMFIASFIVLGFSISYIVTNNINDEFYDKLIIL